MKSLLKSSLIFVLALLLFGVNVKDTLAYFTLHAQTPPGELQTGTWAPPSVILLSPNGGGSLYQGNNYSINWNATAASVSANPITISLYYSTDGGATYPNLIATGEANDGIYNWVVPNIFSSTVKVKVVATDAHTLSASDDSNSNFSIVSPIVMNEFLPNPFGDDGAAKPAGEWVELRNNGAVPVDVAGWALYDAIDSHELVVSTGNSDNNGNPTDGGETVVPAGGFLVVYRNGEGDFELNNTGGDTVRLYNNLIGSGGVLIDSYTYTGDAPENKSYARIPDGFGAFVDPIPTPGQPNIPEQENVVQSTPSPEPSSEPTTTPEPTGTPDVTPTPSQSIEPTIEPTSTPVESPTPEPSMEPTPSPEATIPPTTEPEPTSMPTDGGITGA